VKRLAPRLLPALLAILGVAALSMWLLADGTAGFVRRDPGMDERPPPEDPSLAPPIVGVLTPGTGTPGSARGSWPWFRGPEGDGICHEPGTLARTWPEGGPPALWSVDLGEGHAGAAVRAGRVYVLDYDKAAGADALRCLSLDDGREIWRFAYPVKVKRNHGMSRTVPAVTEKYVVGLGPKLHVTCLDAVSGEEMWMIDLVRRYGSTVPQWYAGQCPFIDGSRVILAPAGPEAMMIAVDLETGKTEWTAPNPAGWKMTHVSIVRADLGGVPTYVYSASRGVVGVAVKTGEILWETEDWKIGIATVATPVPVGDDRVFFSGGYNAGSVMMRFAKGEGGKIEPRVLYRLDADTFGATQQTPILHEGHIYGVRPDGQLTCLDLDGEPLWTSGPKHAYGIAPFLLAGDLIYLMDDDGWLSLVRAAPEGFELLARARILEGPDAWGPLALAGGRLIARDLKRMVCLRVGEP
jgi:outer membrane protein assembly factor BamB